MPGPKSKRLTILPKHPGTGFPESRDFLLLKSFISAPEQGEPILFNDLYFCSERKKYTIYQKWKKITHQCSQANNLTGIYTKTLPSCKATSLQKEIKKRARFKASEIGGKKRQTNLDFPYKDLSKREEMSQRLQAQGITN